MRPLDFDQMKRVERAAEKLYAVASTLGADDIRTDAAALLQFVGEARLFASDPTNPEMRARFLSHFQGA